MKTYPCKMYAFIVCVMMGFAATAQNIVQLSFYAPLISTFEMKYINNHLVVSQDGLVIFDVSNPAVRPRLVGDASYPGDVANQLGVQGTHAYMSHGGNGIFAVYDISNFSSPVLTGSVAIPSTSFSGSGDLEPNGRYVYLAGFDSLYTIDVSNAALPVVTSRINTTHTEFTGSGEIVIDGSTLFLRSPFGIDVYNIANPAAPVLASSFAPLHTFSTGLEIDTVNHRLFSPWVSPLQEFTGHDAYDVSNPAAPQLLFTDSLEFGSGEYGVTGYSYTDTILYISRGGSINAFDVRPATHGFVTGFSGEDVANSTVSIEVRDSVFFNAKRGGLEVLEYTDVVPAECNTPVSLKTRINGTTALLGWNNVKGAKAYVVRHRKANGRWRYDSSLNNIHVLRNLEPNTLYYWQVGSACGITPRFISDLSLTERFTTGAATAGAVIAISPNPVYDALRVTVNDPAAKEIIITDFSGRTVLHFPYVQNGKQVSFSTMPAGVYMVHALNSQKQVISKATFIKK